MPCCNNIIINAGFTIAQKLAFGQLTMQQLHILHYTFRFTTAHIVINCTLKYALHYNTLSFTCGLRTVYLINLMNLICVDIVKCQVKFCLLLDFLHMKLFLTNLVSTGGPHEISRRAACGPRVGHHWRRRKELVPKRRADDCKGS